jgi:hypothetical protein
MIVALHWRLNGGDEDFISRRTDVSSIRFDNYDTGT